MKAKLITLPQTSKEFDEMVKQVCKASHCQDKNRVAAQVANRIMHFPVDQSTTTLEYLVSCVHKAGAYWVAKQKLAQLSEEAYVDDLVSLLTVDEHDSSARDKLERRANEGCEFAKKALKKLFPEPKINSPLREVDVPSVEAG